ncbi:MAG: hypothetical protein ACK5QP_10830, partial [Chitinophagales bacterium]
MKVSNTFKIALASAAGAIVVSSTVLFPFIKDLNKTITEEKVVHTIADKESNKSVQVISKIQNNTSVAQSPIGSRKENPSINSSTIRSTNDPNLHSSDTVKS